MSDDNILFTLLSMGFELEDCEKVIQTGVTDIQDAIQHLLLNQPGQSCSEASSSSTEPLVVGQHSTGTPLSVETAVDKTERNAQIKASYNEQLRKRRLEERMAKDRILKNIETDKLSRKDAKKVRDEVEVSSSASVSSRPTTDTREMQSRIQVRLPDGVSIQLTFNKDTTLQCVMDAVLESVEDKSHSYSIMQPFPRKEFKSTDMSLTIGQLGLVPSARLVLSFPRPEEKIDIDSEVLAALQERAGVAADADMAGCGSSRLLHGNIKNDIKDSDDPALAHRDNTAGDKHILTRQIDTLQKLCALSVAHQLTISDTKIVNSMSHLSSNAATQVINVLKSWKLLSAKLMSCFLPCKLKEIHLDSYGLTTNELLEKLRFHTSVTTLSLRSCGILNDHGVIPCLKGLHNLRYLNLGDCCRLTGIVIEYVADLPYLEVLILDKFKVADGSLNTFLKTKLTTNLKKLSLDQCPVSSAAFSDTPACETLLSLSLNGTKISSLTFLHSFPNLSKLSLKNTHITDNELVHVGKLTKLNVFKLNGTCISDVGLTHLNGLHLKSIDTVDRQRVTDETIAIINGFPLTNLDLSDHIFLTDSCISHIANIVSLTNLSLSNTKITGHDLLQLKDLHNLDTIDFSKTAVTNEVMLLLKSLQSLHTVNLAWTNIDDDIVVELNSCVQIFKLNLSHTSISDKGIVHLKLSRLDTLLLDSTNVTWDGASVCVKNCPNITVLRNSSKKVLITSHR